MIAPISEIALAKAGAPSRLRLRTTRLLAVLRQLADLHSLHPAGRSISGINHLPCLRSKRHRDTRFARGEATALIRQK